MSGRTEIVKGRIEEATGALTGNSKLKAKGKADQSVGQVKLAASKVADKVVKRMRE